MTDPPDSYTTEHKVVPSWGPGEGADADDTPLAWEARVFAVALTWALPGVLFGLLVGLFASLSMAGSGLAGALAGTLAGGLLEADHWA